MPRIACLSDTHGLHDALTIPDGDVLIHAGDTSTGGARELLSDVTYLLDERTDAAGLYIWRQPRLHVFGHIHEGYGRTHPGETILVSASSCDAGYTPVNPPVVIDLP